MKIIVLSVVVGMMLLTVTVGTVAGDGSLMSEDAERNSPSKSFRPDQEIG